MTKPIRRLLTGILGSAMLTTALTTITATVAVPAANATPAVGAGAHCADTSSVAGSITRCQILGRAQYWVDNGVPYTITGATAPDPEGKGYREDCAGLVSMAWHLADSHQVSMPMADSLYGGPSGTVADGYGTAIAKDQLQPGDAVLFIDHHTVLFDGWTDSSETSYYAYEESYIPDLTHHNGFSSGWGPIPWPYYPKTTPASATVVPYRYKNVADVPTIPAGFNVKLNVTGGQHLSGTVNLTATASSSGYINSGKYLITGPNGYNSGPLTPSAGGASNYPYAWNTVGLPIGTYQISFMAGEVDGQNHYWPGGGTASPGAPVSVVVDRPTTAGATHSTVIAPNGHMYQFVRGTDSTLRMWSADFANGWQDQGTNLGGGTIAGEASSIIAPNGHVYTFARGTDNSLRMWSADFATGWQDQGTNLGGNLATDPAVTIAPNGHMYVFAGGADGAMHMWSADFKTGWQDQGTTINGSVASTPSVTIGSNGHMYVFAGGSDTTLRMWSADFANGWQDQGTNLGGNIGGASEVVANNGHMYVFARGGDGTLRMWSTDFNGWIDSNKSLGGSIASDPSVITAPNGHMYVFARSSAKTLQMWSSDFQAGWQDQGTDLGGSIASAPSEVIANNGGMYIFAGGTDATLRMWSANFTSGWQDQGTNLGGGVWF